MGFTPEKYWVLQNSRDVLGVKLSTSQLFGARGVMGFTPLAARGVMDFIHYTPSREIPSLQREMQWKLCPT